MDAQGRSYSAFGHQQLINLGHDVNLLVNDGINAATVAITGTIFKIPSTWNGVLKSVSAYIKTGGTVASAGHVGLIQRSLAGTGAYASIGTLSFLGTHADGAVLAGAVDSSVTVLGGDILRLAVGAGTNLQTLTVTVTAAFQEAFISA